MGKWLEWVKQHPKAVLAGSIVFGMVGAAIHGAGVELLGAIFLLIGVVGIVVAVKNMRSKKKEADISVKDFSVSITGPSDEELRQQIKQSYEENKEEIKAQRKAAKEALNTPEGRDNTWREYGEQSRKHVQEKNYGLYSNTLYNMAMFVKKEDKHLNVLDRLTEVIFWDLTGCGNNFDYSIFFKVTMKSLFPYEDSTMILAPGVIREVGICQKKLEFSDEQLKTRMLEHLQRLTAPVQFFNPVEIVDIFFWERDGDTSQLKKVYSMAQKRFDPKHPNIVAKG